METIYTLIEEWQLPIALLFFIFGLEDLFLDFIYWFRKLRYQHFTVSQFQQINDMDEKLIAIMIGAWHEGNIIQQMIIGNMERIKYKNFHIFIGVYPNDFQTMLEVKKLEVLFPQVHGVVNTLDGPTSKGQMLNEVVSAIRKFEFQSGIEFLAFHMQDAEDIIHPYILKISNLYLEQYDFIQTPVFSLPVGSWEVVAGTYIDEFAQAHYKDMLVRADLNVAIPSAGVGTTIARAFILKLLQSNPDGVFLTKSVTEDYLLGHQVYQLGGKSAFASVDLGNLLGADNPDRFVATREYFPKKFVRSLRQKTRWNLGIIIQGIYTLGWYGKWWDRYFLFRDRKGAFTSLLGIFGMLLLIVIFIHNFLVGLSSHESGLSSLSAQNPEYLSFFLLINFLFMSYFVFQRARCVYFVYGRRYLWWLPMRWPVAITINALAMINACKRSIWASWRKKDVVWGKTHHELPPNFGVMSSSDPS